MRRRLRSAGQAGFSLTEMIIVMLVMIIIFSIGYMSFRDLLTRDEREREALEGLDNLSDAIASFRITHGVYPTPYFWLDGEAAPPAEYDGVYDRRLYQVYKDNPIVLIERQTDPYIDATTPLRDAPWLDNDFQYYRGFEWKEVAAGVPNYPNPYRYRVLDYYLCWSVGENHKADGPGTLYFDTAANSWKGDPTDAAHARPDGSRPTWWWNTATHQIQKAAGNDDLIRWGKDEAAQMPIDQHPLADSPGAMSYPQEPRSPSVLVRHGKDLEARFVELQGDYAYISDFNQGLKVLRVKPARESFYDPDTGAAFVDGEVRYAGYDNNWPIYGLAVAGNYVYEARHSSGLSLVLSRGLKEHNFELAELTALPTQQDLTVADGSIEDIFLSGYYAYLVNYWGEGANFWPPDWGALGALTDRAVPGIRIVNVSDPGSALTIAKTLPLWQARAAVTSGGKLYVSCRNSVDGRTDALEIYDIRAQEEPQFLGRYPEAGSGTVLDGLPKNLAVIGDKAYMVTYAEPGASVNPKLYVISVQDPTDPQLLTQVVLPRESINVYATDKYAYCACGDLGKFQLVPIFDKLIPKINYRWATGASENATMDVQDIYLKGDLAYLACRNLAGNDVGLRILHLGY